jgi:hypothetical protein
LRYSCGHVSTKKNVRGIKDAAASTPPQLRSSRYIRYRDNIGYPRYGERYDIGDNQYSSNNLSYCPINRFLESIMNLMTVLNGHFTMHTGDEVQWYFDFESDKFQHGSTANLANGFRLPDYKGDGNEDGTKLSSKRKKRDEFMDSRVFGTDGCYGKLMGVKNTRCVVRIKSYRMCKEGNMCFDHFGDKTRVFAKCISGGLPFDMVDIMLMSSLLLRATSKDNLFRWGAGTMAGTME